MRRLHVFLLLKLLYCVINVLLKEMVYQPLNND